VPDWPAHTEFVPEIFTPGFGITWMLMVRVVLQPAELVVRTLKVVVEIGLTTITEVVAPPGVQLYVVASGEKAVSVTLAAGHTVAEEAERVVGGPLETFTSTEAVAVQEPTAPITL